MAVSGDAQCNMVYTMYHATRSSAQVQSILANGFNLSDPDANMLGRGVYVSRNVDKTGYYGAFCFKLLVFTGRSITVNKQRHPNQKTWQANHDSAWVPPNCGMVKSGREEHCIADASHIQIVGLIRGFEQLPPNVQALTRATTVTELDGLDAYEAQVLERFLAKYPVPSLTNAVQPPVRYNFLAFRA